jgi:hypothetical protein
VEGAENVEHLVNHITGLAVKLCLLNDNIFYAEVERKMLHRITSRKSW